MKVVSLMAGTSSRLNPLTSDCHKVLLEIGGKSLVEHQLNAFKEVGINQTVFIVGYKAELIKAKLGDYYDGVNIKYVYNPYYSTRNINYSLYLAKNEVIGEDFLYFEADLFFHPSILKIIMDSCWDNCLIVDPNPTSDMVDTLVLGTSNKVTGLLFKDHGDLKDEIKTREDVVGELILLIKFNAKTSKFLFDELEKSNFEGATTLYSIFEKCFEIETMNYAEAMGHPWVEIDNFNDLKKAKELHARGFLP